MDLYEIHCNDTIDSLRVLIACWGVRGGVMARARDAVVTSQTTHVLPLEFNKRYPVLKRGDGVWVEDESGRRYLDAMSGGSMAATLGHGRKDIIAAARAQAGKLAYVHNERLTNPAQERLAEELVAVAPQGFTRARFVTGGAEANEMALQLARRYHVDRGESKRW
ncbi:MAG: aminotransferase class III-fold pyridoxal phosphate-dependent enzyme, partial [Chloroflexi bacterium]